MVRKGAFLALMLATSLAVSTSASLASNGSASRPTSRGPIFSTLSPQLNGPMAALFFVGDRVLGAVRVVTGVGIVKGPTHGTVYQTQTIQDSPDPIGGIKDSRIPTGPTPMPAGRRAP